MDSHKLRRFKLLFEAFGFEPFLGNVKFANYWLSIHAILAIVQFIAVINYSDLILYTYDVIGAFSDKVKCLTSFASYFTAIYVTWANRSDDGNISRQIKNLEALTGKLYASVDDVNEKCYKTLKKRFLFLTAVHFTALVQAVVFQSSETQTQRFLFAFTFPFIFCYVKQLHAIFFIYLINNYFEVLNDQLQNLNELIKFNENHLRNKNYDKFLVKRLKLLRNFHAVLFNLKELENKRMNQFFFVIELNFYVHILSTLYWTTFRIFNQPLNPTICKILIISKAKRF